MAKSYDDVVVVVIIIIKKMRKIKSTSAWYFILASTSKWSEREKEKTSKIMYKYYDTYMKLTYQMELKKYWIIFLKPQRKKRSKITTYRIGRVNKTFDFLKHPSSTTSLCLTPHIIIYIWCMVYIPREHTKSCLRKQKDFKFHTLLHFCLMRVYIKVMM